MLIEINDETNAINSPDFEIAVVDTRNLPSIDDTALTFANFDDKSKKVKLVKTCVVYIDIRRSTKLSFEHQRQTLAKLYSSFVRGVIKCADHFGGKVRNIIGDRVMILFDPEDCFENAVNTAILLNTFSIYVLNKHFRKDAVRCGIGIDYGNMMVTKTGTIKRGIGSSEYKSLVWLSQAANIASKLADVANKTMSRTIVKLGQYYPFISEYSWIDLEIDDFFDNLQSTYSWPIIARFKEPYRNVFSFFKTRAFKHYPAILMTKSVYNGYKAACPQDDSVRKRWWRPRKISEVPTSGVIYGGDVIFTFGRELNKEKRNRRLFLRGQ